LARQDSVNLRTFDNKNRRYNKSHTFINLYNYILIDISKVNNITKSLIEEEYNKNNNKFINCKKSNTNEFYKLDTIAYKVNRC